ncbi:peptidase M24 [Polychaeton citri CBS 116435]|uniref:Xaa-Pro aminopeptidase n=1 Tax=Polychaeton citri CBS 116435 TaxID=1314669 RepID=A0A9P4UUV8_9PEZI|nr:peptidase M24 [Polychaeton citri CBS 116435]
MRRTAPALQPLRAAIHPNPTFRSRPRFPRQTPRRSGSANRVVSTLQYSTARCYATERTVSAAEMAFGQPLHETHPHLIASGDLTQGISALEYHHRRAALASKLPRGGIAVLAANELKYRSGAVFYEYHQDPNFFYLTGFNEPEAVAVIVKGQSDVEYHFHLFVRPKDAHAELWDGARSGVQAAEDVFNADDAHSIDEVSNVLPALLSSATTVYTDIGTGKARSSFSRFFNSGTSQRAEGFAKALQDAAVKPLRPLMNELRLNKSPAELDLMRTAGRVSGEAFTTAIKRSQHTAYQSEKQLWTDLSHSFRSGGLDGEAYVPVVGGGTNALSIHYVRNDAILDPSDLVLVDAGGEVGGYITDITRTWPVSGKFTPAQRDLYQMLLNVQKSCVSLCREDADVTLDRLHRICEGYLLSGLKDLGFDFTRDGLDSLFPHHVGHYIGLDVHDAPGYPRNDRLREAQCITIEPGVYVPADDGRWPQHFRGLGIRIEDSVIVGKERVEVLTGSAVKEVKDIEG